MSSFRMWMLFGSGKIGIPWNSSRTSRPIYLTLMSYSNMMDPTASDMHHILPILDSSTLGPINALSIYSRRCYTIPTWSLRGIRNNRCSFNCLRSIAHCLGWTSKCWVVARRCSQVRSIYAIDPLRSKLTTPLFSSLAWPFASCFVRVPRLQEDITIIGILLSWRNMSKGKQILMPFTCEYLFANILHWFTSSSSPDIEFCCVSSSRVQGRGQRTRITSCSFCDN